MFPFLWFVKNGNTIMNFFNTHKEEALPWTHEIDRFSSLQNIMTDAAVQ